MDFFKERVGFKFLCGVWAILVFFYFLEIDARVFRKMLRK